MSAGYPKIAGSITNPNNPSHFMRIKPLKGTVEISFSDRLIARSNRAVRVLEVGKDLYDPVIYLPKADILVELTTIAGLQTYCPLKGDAKYWSLGREKSEKLAWSYDNPLEIAGELKDLIAFYSNLVTETVICTRS